MLLNCMIIAKYANKCLTIAVNVKRYMNISIQMSGLFYHELIKKIEKHKGEKYLLVDDFMLDKVLDKIKKIIGIEKSDDTKIIKSFKKCCNINYVS